MKYHDQKQLMEETVYLAYISSPVRKARQELKLARNLEAGVGEEAIEEVCLLLALYGLLSRLFLIIINRTHAY